MVEKKRPAELLIAFVLIARETRVRPCLRRIRRFFYTGGLERLARNYGLEDRVVWAGHVDGKQKDELFQNAAVFCLPSSQENFGVAVAEALSTGCPVVLSADVALAPLVADYGAGEVVDGRDPESIARGLSTVLRQGRANYADLARNMYQNECSLSAAAESLLEAVGLSVSTKERSAKG